MTDSNLKKPELPLDGETFRRRQRGRNLALLWSLLALCALFFAITIVQFSKAGHL
jgi:hypothetical protein